jgi:putative membrane protein
MTAELIIRYFHFMGIFCLFAGLVAEHLLMAKVMTRAAIRRLATIDLIYAITALLVLGSGLLLWFEVGKPAVFYTKNALFHTKLLLFVVVAVLSIFPGIYLRKAKNGDSTETVTPPKWVIMTIRTQLLLLCIIPLLAVCMAKGIGSFAS